MSETTRKRPGGYPRRKPKRRNGYSNGSTKVERAQLAVCALLIAAVYCAAAFCGPVV